MKAMMLNITISTNEVTINLLTPNGISRSYQLDQSISIFRGAWWYFSFLFKFNRTFCKQPVENLILK